MTEPNYIYKKGEGWIPSIEHIVTLRDGKVVRLEFRHPKPGEYFDFFALDHPKFFLYSETSTPEPNWKAWENQISCFSLPAFCLANPDEEWASDTGYMVVIPV